MCKFKHFMKHIPETVIEKHIILNIELQTDHLIPARRQDLFTITKHKKRKR